MAKQEEFLQRLDEAQKKSIQKQLQNFSEERRELIWELLAGDEFVLNPRQAEALVHDHDKDGPLLILAGAGSGKTAIVIRRIVYLYLLGYDPEEVIAITFTNKAAREMLNRAVGLLVDLRDEAKGETKKYLDDILKKTGDAWVGTFHSLGRRMLKLEHPESGRPLSTYIHKLFKPPFHILDQDERVEFFGKCFHDTFHGTEPFELDDLEEKIIKWRQHGLTPGDLTTKKLDDLKQKARKLYRKYQTEKYTHQPTLLDFQDLLLYPVQLLRDDENTGDFLRQKFKHVLIDEFQDTNPVQFQLAGLLSEGSNNLIAVGDDAQAIYAWRGADITNIQDFQEHFPNSKVIRLEENYRSQARIVMSANEVFRDDDQVEPKQVKPAKGDATGLSYGQKISLYKCLTDREERGLISYKIKNLVWEDKYELGDFVIFVRVNRQLEPIQRHLDDEGIPNLELGDRSFFEIEQVKLFLSALRIVYGIVTMQIEGEVEDNSFYSDELEKWFQRPEASFTDEFFEKIHREGEIFLSIVRDKRRKQLYQKLKDEDQKQFKKELELFNQLIEVVSDGGEILELAKTIGSEDETGEKKDVISGIDFKTLFVDWVKRTSEGKGREGLENFLRAVEEQKMDPQFVAGDPKKFVKLTTLHGAKGLEFAVVFFTGLEEEVCPYKHPHVKDYDKDRLAEEKRLFYVGITRAEDELNLIWVKRRDWFGSPKKFKKSRFLKLLPKDMMLKKRPPRSFLQSLTASFVR